MSSTPRARKAQSEKTGATGTADVKPKGKPVQSQGSGAPLGLLALALGVGLLAWYGAKTFGLLGDAGKPEVSGSQAFLPGMRFGPLKPADIPKVSPDKLHLDADVEKREAIKKEFVHSYHAYERCAMGADELHPLSCSGSNLTAAGGIGYTVIDSLDSLLIMGLKPEYKRAVAWCQKNLDFNKDAEFNTFETTIRVLGGLLAAHYLSSVSPDPEIASDAPFFLEQAVNVGDRILGAFDTPTGIPYSSVNLATREGIPDKGNNGLASLAEATTLQLEFKYLAYLTDDNVYWRKAERVMQVVRNQASQGVAPIFISPQHGGFVASDIRLGSRGDSYYEYLLKQWLQTNREEPVYKDMYDHAMEGIKNLLVSRTQRKGLFYTHELAPAKSEEGQQTWRVVPKQDHLVCFLGGSLMLGVTEGNRRSLDWNSLDDKDKEDFIVGQGIVESCVDTYDTATGLGAEIVMFNPPGSPDGAERDWYIKPGKGLIDSRNILRPETVESLFLAYRSTGDERYREWGWKIFKAFEKHCRVEKGGYAIIKDVQENPATQEDRMETFWLSETLKYLYLLFDDSDHIPLDKHVFNTEAHILPVFTPPYLTAFAQS